MSKKEEFIAYVKDLMNDVNETVEDMPESVRTYWEAFCNVKEVEKPLFTENGKLVLSFLKEHTETEMWKAKEIGEGLGVSSRTVSGAMRKLVDDKYVEKVSTEPTVYSLTQKGKDIEIN